jgi:hypothetical protein
MSTARVTDYVITPEAVETAGCVTYWRVSGDVNIDAFTKAWIDAGLDAKFLRKAPEPATALRRAVLGLADRKAVGETKEIRTLVRPQQEPHSWAVVTEVVEKGEAPRYSTQVIVSFVDGHPQFETLTHSEEDASNISARVLLAYNSQQGSFATEDITGWLVKLARLQGAITLRESGGVYFIPRPSMDFWTKAADVVEAVSGKGHQVFRIPAMKNSEAVAAIVDAIQAEAAKVAETMEEELLATGDDQLGKRAVKTRQTDVEALLGKLADYETLLGLQLDVRARVEALQANLAAAAMLALPGEAVSS